MLQNTRNSENILLVSPQSLLLEVLVKSVSSMSYVLINISDPAITLDEKAFCEGFEFDQ